MGLNNCSFIGRLTRDVDVATVGENNVKVASFTLAVDRSYKSKNENDPTADFIPVQVWRKKAEFAENYFSKGKQVYATGRLETYSYDKDGRTVYAFRLKAEDIGFADTLKGSGNAQTNETDSSRVGNDDNFDISDFPAMDPEDFEDDTLPF